MYKVIGGDEQEYGPVTDQEVRQWIAEGRLSVDSLARAEGSEEWRRLRTFPQFEDALRAQLGDKWTAAEPPPKLSAFEPRGPMFPGDLDVRACLSGGWHLLRENFSLIFAATFLVWTVEMISQFHPLLAILYWTLHGVLFGGLCLVVLKRVRGQPTSVGEVFSGFGTTFGQLALVGMVTSILTRVGLLFCVVPWIYLTVAWVFSVPLAAERESSFWQAMEWSRRTVDRIWLKVFKLMLIAFLPLVLMTLASELMVFSVLLDSMRETFGTTQPGINQLLEKMPDLLKTTAHKTFPWMLATKGVLLLNLPFALGALMHAYDQLFGETKSPGA